MISKTNTGRFLTRITGDFLSRTLLLSARTGLATLVLTLGVVLFPTQARAQIACTGTACALLPFSRSNLDKMYTEFQNQYTNTLFDNIAEAALAANLMGPPIGSVHLEGFTLGTNVSVAMLEPSYVDVNITGVGTLDNLPTAGAAINPRVFVGANLGQLFGLDYDPFSGASPSFFSLARFDVYISLMDVNKGVDLASNNSTGGKIKGSAYHRGVEVRYHLVEGSELAGPFLKFLGVSLGAGYYKTRQSVEFTQDAFELAMTMEGQNIVWEANNLVSWDTSIESYPLEVRSGVQLLYFLNLTLGLGFSFNKGYSDFIMSRSGPVYLKSDLINSLNISVPDTSLSAVIKGNGKVPARQTFVKAGVELNIPIVKIMLEGMWTGNTRSANLGVRLDF